MRPSPEGRGGRRAGWERGRGGFRSGDEREEEEEEEEDAVDERTGKREAAPPGAVEEWRVGLCVAKK